MHLIFFSFSKPRDVVRFRMHNLTAHRWTWLLAETALFNCHLILQDDNVTHLSFSVAAHTNSLDFLRQHGITIQPLPQRSDLARHIHNALAAYANGRSQLHLSRPPASPFWANGTLFQRRVWTEISHIPYGKTRTYGELATRIGLPKGARAVGQACHANPLALIIPCHRVVAAHGLGGFAGDLEIKQRLLALEQSRPKMPPLTAAES